jgi:hypothetical protein
MSKNFWLTTTAPQSAFIVPAPGCAYGINVSGTTLGTSTGFAGLPMRERVDGHKAVVGRRTWSPPIT